MDDGPDLLPLAALFDRRTIASNLKIFNQDLAVLSKVRPERVPDSWQQEVSVKSDALQIAFRQKIKANWSSAAGA